MKKITRIFLCPIIVFIASCGENDTTYNGLPAGIITSGSNSIVADTIVYHAVRIDENGDILPWHSANPGQSYSDALERVWKFWKNMEKDSNNIPYYMNHQVWRPGHDKRGLGGDQLMMALSSWDLYYNFTGDTSLIENMKFMADHYLEHSLSRPGDDWPGIPYPYNMNVESGIYDGDMILGINYTQPDKAGSFGYELVRLYKKTGDAKYLDAAIKIANTLASKVQPGNADNSPWPFKINAVTGDTGVLLDQEVWYEGINNDLHKKKTRKSSYTTNYTGAMNLFAELAAMNKGNTSEYKKAFDLTFQWMASFPARNNKWGPFFEDVPRWSDTQINAITYAMFLMENSEKSPGWKETVKNIFNWVYDSLTDKRYAKYGVTVIDEQTAYRQPGNSHSSRQASIELLYWKLAGDTSYVRNAVRMLHWATYMVDDDGKNFYPTNDIWLTDGYGDYTRHYLRAMAACPQLAPDNSDHLLQSSSVIKKINYAPAKISYTTFDPVSNEVLRMQSKPAAIKVNGKTWDGWSWQSLEKGGVVTIKKSTGNQVEIIK